MSITQYVVIGVFILFIIVGVFVFATYGGSSGEQAGAVTVTIWGTVPSEHIDALEEVINKANANILSLNYEEIPAGSFESEFVNALAEGVGPDAIIISEGNLLSQKNKLALIPFKYFSERSIKDTFVEAGEIFITPEGSYAIPFSIDPLVMYWNREMFNAAGIANPPQYWDELESIVPKITKLSPTKSVLKSTLPFGEYRNVNNAKYILSSLAMQAGGRIVSSDEADFEDYETGANTMESSLIFYTQFADPTNPLYSWNRSLPDAEKMFIAGDLALYFGFASELPQIQEKNPNLNFDVALLPQIRNSDSKITFGEILGLAVVANSPNKLGALTAFQYLVSSPAVEVYSVSSGLPPVRRDLLSVAPGTASKEVFWNSAIWSKNWLDPNPMGTSKAMLEMVESVTSGASEAGSAVSELSQQIDEFLKQTK